MPSISLGKFKAAKGRAERLLLISTDPRLRPVTYSESEPAMHAALAAAVSAWEAYIESITRESLDTIAATATPEVLTLTLLLRAEADAAIKKFNTPNAEGCRELILKYTGFDTFPVMQSTALGMSALQARTRLNEVLKVRHAFAHGYAIPTYTWTTRNGTSNRLTKRAVKESIRLISDLVASVDVSLGAHIKTLFPSRTVW